MVIGCAGDCAPKIVFANTLINAVFGAERVRQIAAQRIFEATFTRVHARTLRGRTAKHLIAINPHASGCKAAVDCPDGLGRTYSSSEAREPTRRSEAPEIALISRRRDDNTQANV